MRDYNLPLFRLSWFLWPHLTHLCAIALDSCSSTSQAHLPRSSSVLPHPSAWTQLPASLVIPLHLVNKMSLTCHMIREAASNFPTWKLSLSTLHPRSPFSKAFVSIWHMRDIFAHLWFLFYLIRMWTLWASLVYAQRLEECLVHSKCSINVFWINE